MRAVLISGVMLHSAFRANFKVKLTCKPVVISQAGSDSEANQLTIMRFLVAA